MLWLFAPGWWLVTYRLRGRLPLKEAAKMLAFVAHSPFAYYLYQPTLLYLLPLYLHWRHGMVLPTSVWLFPLLVQTYVWAYQALPPAVVLLGSSRNETFELRYALERALHPYRVVCLLKPELADRTQHGRFKRTLFEWDNLWSIDSAGWREIAYPLMDIASFIVVDARIATEGVTEEAGRIARGPLLRKTLFVAHERSQQVLEAHGLNNRSVGVRAVSEEQVVPILKSMGLTETASPDDLWCHRDGTHRTVDDSRRGTPRTSLPYTFALLILIGVILTAIRFGYLMYLDRLATGSYNPWLVGVLSIVCTYACFHYKYIFALPNAAWSPADRMFILGRRLCFLVFPSLTLTITLLVLHLTSSARAAVVSGVTVGYLLAKALQVTIFAHEYEFRDRLG